MHGLSHHTRFFDAEIVQILVNYDGVTSALPPFAPGLSLLMGKNGTGKSSFLNSLAHFGTESVSMPEGPSHRSSEVGRFPQLTLRFRLPEEDEYIEYLEFVNHFRESPMYKELIETTEYFDQVEADRRLLNLPMSETIVAALDRDFTRASSNFKGQRMSASDALRSLGISESEIASFERRQDRRREQESRQMYELAEHSSLHYREFFCEYLLTAMAETTFWFSPHWGGVFPVEPLSSTYWTESEERLRLFVAALRDIFERGELELRDVEPIGNPQSSRVEMRFSIPANATDSIRKFAVLADGDRQSQIAAMDNQNDSFTLTFPYDLIHTDKTSNRCFTFGLAAEGSQLGGTSTSTFNRADAFVRTSRLSATTNSSIIRQLWEGEYEIKWQLQVDSHLSELKRRTTDENDALFEVSGTATGLRWLRDVLDETSRHLRELDIGVAELNVSDPTQVEFRFLNWGLQNHGLPTDLKLTYRSGTDTEWRAIDLASDGQRACILAVLNLVRRIPQRATNTQRSGWTVIVADEIDRHLHPTSADRLLSLLHNVARKAGVTIIASTHSVPLLRAVGLRECRRIFAVRDALDQITLTTEPASDVVSMAAALGTDTLRARSLFSLHIVVEGEIDSVILEHLLDDPALSRSEFEIIQLDGLKNLTRDWRCHLSSLTSPILVVYDKQSQEFENAWRSLTSVSPEPWANQPELQSLQRNLRSRKSEEYFRSGDTELRELLRLSREVLEPSKFSDYKQQAQRLHFFGLEVDDIVDYLPINKFRQRASGLQTPGARPSNWAEARRAFHSKRGDDFKNAWGITVRNVKTVLEQLTAEGTPLSSPRLNGLRALVIGLINRSDDPRLG